MSHFIWNQFALCALPRSTGLEEGSEKGDMDSNQSKNAEEDSRLGIFDFGDTSDSSSFYLEDDRIQIQGKPELTASALKKVSEERDRPGEIPLEFPQSECHSDSTVLFEVASVYEFSIDKNRLAARFPYLSYVAGEIFDVLGEKGELWLARNQDDSHGQFSWIWNKNFAKLEGSPSPKESSRSVPEKVIAKETNSHLAASIGEGHLTNIAGEASTTGSKPRPGRPTDTEDARSTYYEIILPGVKVRPTASIDDDIISIWRDTIRLSLENMLYSGDRSPLRLMVDFMQAARKRSLWLR